MASGKEHDQGILIGSIPVGAITFYITRNAQITGIIFASFVIGGLWLSPDLDTKSLPYYRWGSLRFIWIPYQKFIPHRGNFYYRNPLSHFPVLGTIIRVGYLWVWLILAIAIVDSAFKTNYVSYISQIKDWMLIYQIFIGLEVSAWVHLALDILATARKRNW